MSMLRWFILGAFLSSVLEPMIFNPASLAQVKQPSEVSEAYQVCETFQNLLKEQLDFSRAYEATFVRNSARRRAIAVKDGEFETDLTTVDNNTVIGAYKNRMQLFYLMLPLASPENKEEEALFFPSQIKEIFERKSPRAPAEFPAYAAQLGRDVSVFRAHLERLSAQYDFVAERVRKFKEEVLSTKFVPPETRVIEPLRDPFETTVLRKNEPHYEIEGYTVVREGEQMRIAGIRFFTRLF